MDQIINNAQERARDLTQAALLQFFSNLLRVSRGAGKPNAIMNQLAELNRACSAFRDATGRLPDAETLLPALRWELDHEEFWKLNVNVRQLIRAQEKVARGALQMVASRLLGQSTQEAAGKYELYDGINALQEWRDNSRSRSRSFALSSNKRGANSEKHRK